MTDLQADLPTKNESKQTENPTVVANDAGSSSPASSSPATSNISFPDLFPGAPTTRDTTSVRGAQIAAAQPTDGAFENSANGSDISRQGQDALTAQGRSVFHAPETARGANTAARFSAMESHLGNGTNPVTPVKLTVGDRQIEGVATLKHDRVTVYDTSTNQAYRWNPPTEANPQGSLQPLNHRGRTTGEPVAVTQAVTRSSDGTPVTYNRAPVTTDNRAPVVTDNRAPVVTDNRAPVVTAPAVTDNRVPVVAAPAVTDSRTLPVTGDTRTLPVTGDTRTPPAGTIPTTITPDLRFRDQDGSRWRQTESGQWQQQTEQHGKRSWEDRSQPPAQPRLEPPRHGGDAQTVQPQIQPQDRTLPPGQTIPVVTDGRNLPPGQQIPGQDRIVPGQFPPGQQPGGDRNLPPGQQGNLPPGLHDGKGLPGDGRGLPGDGRGMDGQGRLTKDELAAIRREMEGRIPQLPTDRGPKDIQLTPTDGKKPGEVPGGLQGKDGRPGGDPFQQLNGDPKFRQQVLDIIDAQQKGKLNQLDVPNKNQIQDSLKELGPERLAQLRALMLDQNAKNPFDQTGQNKVNQFLETVRNPAGKDGQQIAQPQTDKVALRPADKVGMQPVDARSPAERLQDFVKQNQSMIDKVPNADATRNAALELGKILKDYNTQVGLEPGKGGLTMRDVMGRNFDDAAKSLTDKPTTTLTFKNPDADQAVNKALVDRVQGLLPLGPHNRADGADAVVRAELAGKNFDALTKPDATTRTDATAKAENIVRSEAAAARELAANLKPETNVKAELKAQEGKGDGKDAATQKVVAEAATAQQGILQPPKDAAQIQKEKELQEEQYADPNFKLREEEKIKAKAEENEEIDEQRLMNEAMTLMAMRKKKELQEKEEQEKAQEKDKKEPERRVKYIVKPGDTLESIASKQLRDKRLASLIYEINSKLIPIRMQGNKRVPHLEPKMVIWLPTTTEIKEFRGKLLAGGPAEIQLTASKFVSAEEELEARFGKNWSNTDGGGDPDSVEDMAAAAIASARSRRANIEALLGPLKKEEKTPGKIKYLVRLGDTLKSIAIKHPGLQDVTLWKLLAEINRLPTKVDEKGHPTASLRRGMPLVIPSPDDIAEFRKRENEGGSSATPASFELPTKACPTCKRATISSAAICPGCGTVFNTLSPNAVAKSKVSNSKSKKKGQPSASEDSGGHPSDDSSEKDDVTSFVLKAAGMTTGGKSAKTNEKPKEGDSADESSLEAGTPELIPDEAIQLSEVARVLSWGTPDDLRTGFKSRLEVLIETTWTPVLAYEIYEETSLRHEYRPEGRKTIRIDLPPLAAVQLADNDLRSNWHAYCDKVLKSRVAPI